MESRDARRAGRAIALGISLLVPSTTAIADSSKCQTVPAHHTVQIQAPGEYANPANVGGKPTQSGCTMAYIVDFVSPDKPMNSFVPDQDWLKHSGASSECQRRECNSVGYFPLSASISLYRCTSKRDCLSHRYEELVGSYSVYYDRVGIRPPHCAGVRDKPVPTARNTHGVRMVIKHNLQRWVPLGPQQLCEKVEGFLPPEVGFNASGRAGFRVAAPVEPDKRRPRAEPAK